MSGTPQKRKVLDTFSLAGKTAVVTGGAGLYGRQIAEALAEAGARTFMASRNQEKLQAQAVAFREAGLDVTAMELDQGSEESVSRLLRHVVDVAGRVDVLVNNAVLRPMADWSSPAEAFARSMQVNATGVFMMTRAFGEHMAAHGSGSIINVGSIQGMVGPDFTLYEGLDWGIPPDYFFHKAGMVNFSRFAASKLGPRGVRVNTISPGGFFNHQDPKFVERYNARTFLGRMAGETDLKGIVVFLASDASAYITGANIAIDAGYTSK
ncbi:MAG: SDR family oxidoreductase [Pirellulales bacterium]|nr:SDR family oxidoreductase [Pirellulales bacterium]